MRQLLDLLDVGVGLINEEGKVIFLNKFIEERFGKAQRGRPYYETLRSLQLISLIHDTYASKRDEEGIVSYRERRYRVRTFYTPEGIGLFVEDITEKEEFEKLKKEFLANLSHEMRTPLSVAILSLETLYKESQGEERNLLEKALSRLRELEELLNTVYMLTLFEKEEPKKEEVDLKELLTELLKELQKEIEEKKIRVELHLKERHLKGDTPKLKILFKNLLENAIRYNVEGGKVEVESVKEEKGIRISFKDTGVGIDKGKIPFLFEPFFKGENSKGLGLGLALAKRVVDLHGGKVSVESKPGKGTEVRILFPT